MAEAVSQSTSLWNDADLKAVATYLKDVKGDGQPAPAPLAGLRCLVVADDPAILDGSRALLEQWGCQVECVATGAEAIARLGTGDIRYHAVLCDLQLAGDGDGVDVIEAAKRLQPDALAVLVSGATGPEVLQRLRHGGVMLLTKPVAPAKLRALLTTRRQAHTV